MARLPHPHSDRELVARIARSAGSKASYKQLVRELGLGGGRERRLLLEQLSRIAARGDLRKLDDGLFALPETRPEPGVAAGSSPSRPKVSSRHGSGDIRQGYGGRDRLLSGRLELHRDGFGFVRMDSAPERSGAGAPQDVFIPPVALHGAMHGDLVLVEEGTPARDGRRSGQIARVLTRRNPTVVGTFHYARARARHGSYRSEDGDVRSGNYVQPWDERLGGPIEIPPGAELEGVPADAHRTMDGAAVRRGPDSDERWPLEGLVVDVEITQFAQPGRTARGRVIEVLGPPDAFGVDVEIVIRKHAIQHTFPAHVLTEAATEAQNTVASLPESELARREDFRGLPVITIDGESARDFDDAVLVRPLPNGHTELQVHIADVAWYVRAGSALDTEARVRGTSVYFPDRAVPMLPHALSSGLCSLLPGEDRLVQSCLMEVDARGEIVSYRVTEGIIRSARRMTYTSVQQCLNASPHAASRNADARALPEPTVEDQAERERVALEQPELVETLDRMLELALQLNAKRARRGSIDFDLPEPVVQFDPEGNMKAIVRSERGWAHRLIEEFMLSANECVATWLTAQGVSSLYRIHEMPDPKRVLDFEESAAGFGHSLGIGAIPVKRLTMKSDRREVQRRSGRSQHAGRAPSHEVPQRLPVTPQMYQRLTKRIAGQPEERILAYLMLRSLKQARYAEKNEGHFALASPCYTHFTSPIRRYPDLIVHRLLRTLLRLGADPRGGAILSSDTQPWAMELARSQGQHSSGAPRRVPLSTLPVNAPPQEKWQPNDERSGRIGWSTEEQEISVRREGAKAPEPDRLDTGSEPRSRSASSFPRESSLSAEELTDIATESSQAERRAVDAERELIEWKKMKFMADRVGDDFNGIILSVTKYGFFVELDELFIEGLVPLASLTNDLYRFRDTDHTICGAHTGHCFRVGDRVEVILDRIDRQMRRLQFALRPGTELASQKKATGSRSAKIKSKKLSANASETEKRSAHNRKQRRRKH